MSPGKARLWAGIGCVGTMVMTAVFLLTINAPENLLPTTENAALQEYLSILACFIAAVCLLLPFDFIGGMLIPAAFEDRPPKFEFWLRRWLRSVAIQVAFYSITFFLYLQIGREIGASWLIAMFAVVQLTLLAGQELIWRVMTAQRIGHAGEDSAVYVQNSDQRFVGGITGLPGFESILVPADWKTRLRPAYLKMVVTRRRAALQSGGRFRGILFAMLWNITSFTAAVMMGGAVISSVASLMTVFLWFLLFSFVGLLVLPTFNRMSVFASDQSLTDLIEPVELGQAIREVDQLTERDPKRSVSAESVFQPIPCSERRATALSESGPHHVPAWNVARTALFLSWAFGGPLARAVHCNVGRPELWAILPTD